MIIKNGTHIKDKNKLYYTYIHSKIWYGIEQACEIQIKKVQIQQNRAIKILYTKQLYNDLNLLLVQDIYKTSIA